MCTTCNAKGKPRPATFVARDADGLEWFECSYHESSDNVAATVRVALVPIGQWLARRAEGRAE